MPLYFSKFLENVMENFFDTGDPRFARFRLTRIHSTRIFLGLQTLLLRGTLFSVRRSLCDSERFKERLPSQK